MLIQQISFLFIQKFLNKSSFWYNISYLNFTILGVYQKSKKENRLNLLKFYYHTLIRLKTIKKKLEVFKKENQNIFALFHISLENCKSLFFQKT